MTRPRPRLLLLAAAMACFSDPAGPTPGPDAVVVRRSFVSDTIPHLFIGAGDIAGCGSFYIDEVTAKLVASVLAADTGTRAFTAGDNAYPSGRVQDWNCFNLSWGKFKARTWYSVGNHEYNLDTAATATYDYVLGVGVDSAENGRRGKFYHAHDLGAWRIYFLNTQRNIPEQTAWLKADMAANPRACQMMIFHRPLHSAGTGELAPARPLKNWHMVFWKAHGDVVVTGHAHHYRRTANIRPDTTAGALAEATAIDTGGYRQFVEGGGGHRSLSDFPPPLAYDEVRIKSNGVLKFMLGPRAYKWERLDTAGVVVDHGERGCH